MRIYFSFFTAALVSVSFFLHSSQNPDIKIMDKHGAIVVNISDVKATAFVGNKIIVRQKKKAPLLIDFENTQIFEMSEVDSKSRFIEDISKKRVIFATGDCFFSVYDPQIQEAIIPVHDYRFSSNGVPSILGFDRHPSRPYCVMVSKENGEIVSYNYNEKKETFVSLCMLRASLKNNIIPQSLKDHGSKKYHRVYSKNEHYCALYKQESSNFEDDYSLDFLQDKYSCKIENSITKEITTLMDDEGRVVTPCAMTFLNNEVLVTMSAGSGEIIYWDVPHGKFLLSSLFFLRQAKSRDEMGTINQYLSVSEKADLAVVGPREFIIIKAQFLKEKLGK
jgi:hypothetical protein